MFRSIAIFVCGIIFGSVYRNDLLKIMAELTMWCACFYSRFEIADEKRRRQADRTAEIKNTPRVRRILSNGCESPDGLTTLTTIIPSSADGGTLQRVVGHDQQLDPIAVTVANPFMSVEAVLDGKTYDITLHSPGKYTYCIRGAAINSDVILHFIRTDLGIALPVVIADYTLNIMGNDCNEVSLTRDQMVVIGDDGKYDVK